MATPKFQFLTPEQEARVPEYQEKWRQIALSTEKINQGQAAISVIRAYKMMGQKEPNIVFCKSPDEALQYLRQSVNGDDMEKLVQSVTLSPEQAKKMTLEAFEEDSGAYTKSFFKVFISTALKATIFKPKFLQKKNPIIEVLSKLTKKNNKQSKILIKHLTPKNLTTQEKVEISFTASQEDFERLGEERNSETGESLKRFSITEESEQSRQESFSQTAASFDSQLGCLPFGGLFINAWLPTYLQAKLAGKVTRSFTEPSFDSLFPGIVPPSMQDMQIMSSSYILSASDWCRTLCWLDFSKFVLGFSYDERQYEALKNVVMECGYIFTLDGTCFICDRPKSILLDQRSRLHADGQPAMQFRDGFSLYAHHGAPLPEKYGQTAVDQWPLKWSVSQKEFGFQEFFQSHFGATRLCQELDDSYFSVLEIEGDYSLLKLKTKNQSQRILRRINSENGDMQAEFIPWPIESVQQALHHARDLGTEKFV